MKRMVFVLLLVVLLLSLALPVVAMAGAGYDDPCTPGWSVDSGNGQCFLVAPGWGGNNNNGNAGDNWIVPEKK
jgi:hypothetical protein